MAEGLDVFTCSVCGDSYEEVLPATGHKYDKTVVEPTCIHEGTDIYTCSACGDSYHENIPALGHSQGEAVVSIKPGVFSDGEQTISCTSCGEILETIRIPQTFPISFEKTIAIIVGIAVLLGGIIAGFVIVKKNSFGRRKEQLEVAK